MKITAKKITSWGPCHEYGSARVKALVPRGMTPLEILDIAIPIENRLWVVLRFEVLTESQLRLFAVLCAERALRLARRIGQEPDKRSWEACRVARLHAQGKATDKELAVAVHAASRAHADAAAYAAHSDAASRARVYAAYADADAAHAAAYAAANDVTNAYSAASAAASAAARAAAYAATATSVVCAVAYASAAAHAAASSVYDAERKWQIKQLRKLIRTGK